MATFSFFLVCFQRFNVSSLSVFLLLSSTPWPMAAVLLRGGIVNRTYGTHKNLYV